MNGVDLVGGTFTNPAALADVRWQMVGTGDFNLDGRPDILWRHDASGENVVWFMSGTTLRTGGFTNPSLPDTSWRIVGVDDFDRDGKPDLVWHHGLSGKWSSGTWMAPTSPAATSQAPPEFRTPNWSVVAVGDYNGDARPDLLGGTASAERTRCGTWMGCA